jgi:KGK domain
MSQQGYQRLTTKDVVFVEGLENSSTLFKTDATLRVKDLLSKIEAICLASGQLSPEEIQILFRDGLNCELLRPGAPDWTQGRLQLSLEFVPAGTAPAAAPTTSATTSAPVAVVAPIAPPQPPAPVVTTPPAAVVTPAAPVAPAPVAPAPVVASATIDRSTIDRASVSAPIAAPAPFVIIAEAPEAEPEAEVELDIAHFANATDHEINIPGEVDIDHSDVFSLMEDPSITPLADDFSFGEALAGLEGLEFDASVTAKSISSPWDLEELDSMLLVK